MSWEERLLGAADLHPYLTGADEKKFSSKVAALIEQQKVNWDSLREGYDALAYIETKRVELDGSRVVVQHNARRMRSTAAAVDKTSIQARKCFLCSANLP